MTDPVTELEFLLKIQRVRDEGDFVATYKFALLNALADISVESDVGAGQVAGLRRLARGGFDHQQRRGLPIRLWRRSRACRLTLLQPAPDRDRGARPDTMQKSIHTVLRLSAKLLL